MKKIFSLLVAGLMGLSMTAQTWNFKTVGATDAANLNADTENWTYDATNKRWGNKNTLENAPLKANGVELSYTKDILFTVPAAEGIRPGDKRLALNNKGDKMTLKNLKAGYTVEISWCSSSGTTARSLLAENLTFVSGVEFGKTTSNTEVKTVATVTADGDVTLSCNEGALYMFGIAVKAPGEDPKTTLYDVSINPAKPQMAITLKEDVKFYDVDALKNVEIHEGKVTVNPKEGNSFDQFATSVVKKISYAQAQTAPTDPEIINPEKGIEVLAAQGWQESAYITFKKYEGAETYRVEVNGKAIDGQLIRDYGSYVRADAVGLKAGTYSLHVVALDKEGKEIADAENTVNDIEVMNYDRQGYAHFGNYGTGVGAYKDNGELKDDAVVLYVTSANFNTITLDLPSSDKGAMTTYTGLGEIFYGLQKGYTHKPICVRLIGFIDRNKVAAAQLKSDQGSLLLKGNANTTLMEVTIEGIGNDCWMNSGLGFVNGCNVEVRNIGIGGHPKGKDCIEVRGTHHVWIHNMDFFYAEKGSGDQVKGDGTLDSKDKCSYATFSYNHYFDCGKANLCGMKSEVTDNLICYHHNWFDHSDSRHPRVRTSTVHVWNNYYDGVAKYGIGATMGCSIFSEGNFFRGMNYPMLSSNQGRDAEGDGTFSGENGGIIKSFGNVFSEKGAHFACYTQNTPGRAENDFDVYEVETADEKVPATVKTLAGGTGYNNFDTDSKTMYAHTAIPAVEVPAVVTGYYGAGRMQHGDLGYKFNNAVDDSNYDYNEALWAVISGYKSKLVGIVGGETLGSGGNTGNEGDGNDGDDKKDPDPTETGAVVCSFTGNTPSSSQVVVTGNYSNSKGTVTYGGVEYSVCVKMESATQVVVTPVADCTVTFIFGGSTSAANQKIKLDGEAVTLDANGQTTVDGTAGTAITLTKGDSINLFLILITPKE